MAGSAERYAQVSETLIDHPKTTRVCRTLKMHRMQLVGHLSCLWIWCLKNAPDGDLSRFSERDIADAARFTDADDFSEEEDDRAKTFVAALTACHDDGEQRGFIDLENGRMSIHAWDEYGGRLLETRRRNADKQARHRERSVTSQVDNSDITVTSQVDNGNPLQSRAEQSRAEQSEEKQSRADAARAPEALPALPFDASVEPALPSADVTVGLLSEPDVGDLLKSRWTMPEILWGCAILRERPKLPENAKGLLHASILAEVRAGKRPKCCVVKARAPARNGHAPPPVFQGDPPPLAVLKMLKNTVPGVAAEIERNLESRKLLDGPPLVDNRE